MAEAVVTTPAGARPRLGGHGPVLASILTAGRWFDLEPGGARRLLSVRVVGQSIRADDIMERLTSLRQECVRFGSSSTAARTGAYVAPMLPPALVSGIAGECLEFNARATASSAEFLGWLLTLVAEVVHWVAADGPPPEEAMTLVLAASFATSPET
ncbi:MAG: hypothetical protein ACKVZ6_05600 [Kineosporiaceae bacterium]|jgi:hypothetical protein